LSHKALFQDLETPSLTCNVYFIKDSYRYFTCAY
jgi:hypothetical protein